MRVFSAPGPVRCMLSAAVLSTVVVALPLPARSLDVTACGQTVPAGTVGVLVGDLVCPFAESITLERGATLQMNGYAVSAESSVNGHVGIACLAGRCRVEGPGRVSGFGGVAITGLDPSRLEVSDVEVSDSGIGILGNRLKLNNVQLRAHQDWGASADRLVATNVAAFDNPGYGITGKNLRLTDVSATGNGHDGVYCNRLRAERLTSTGNGGYGVRAIYPGVNTLKASTVTGNTTADIGAQRTPRLPGGTTCGTSRRLSEGSVDLGTWGVCTND